MYCATVSACAPRPLACRPRVSAPRRGREQVVGSRGAGGSAWVCGGRRCADWWWVCGWWWSGRTRRTWRTVGSLHPGPLS
eukprot:3715853-Prymnesium_polylepis.1